VLALKGSQAAGLSFDLKLEARYEFQAGFLVFKADITNGIQPSYDLMLAGAFKYSNLQLAFEINYSNAANARKVVVTVGVQGNRESMIKHLALMLDVRSRKLEARADPRSENRAEERRPRQGSRGMTVTAMTLVRDPRREPRHADGDRVELDTISSGGERRQLDTAGTRSPGATPCGAAVSGNTSFVSAPPGRPRPARNAQPHAAVRRISTEASALRRIRRVTSIRWGCPLARARAQAISRRDRNLGGQAVARPAVGGLRAGLVENEAAHIALMDARGREPPHARLPFRQEILELGQRDAERRSIEHGQLDVAEAVFLSGPPQRVHVDIVFDHAVRAHLELRHRRPGVPRAWLGECRDAARLQDARELADHVGGFGRDAARRS
jgi:hypothetical protein